MIPKALTDFVTEHDLPLQAVHLWTIWVVSKGDINKALFMVQSFEENAKLVTQQQINSVARLREAAQKAAAEEAIQRSFASALNKHARTRVEVLSAEKVREDLWN